MTYSVHLCRYYDDPDLVRDLAYAEREVEALEAAEREGGSGWKSGKSGKSGSGSGGEPTLAQRQAAAADLLSRLMGLVVGDLGFSLQGEEVIPCTRSSVS
jgi:hypothetical protein